jgi:hypothetical protein
MPVATCYRFVRCQVHPAFDDVQGWFLEVRGDDPELLAALHRSITAKYRSMFGEDSHGKPGPSSAELLAADWLRSAQAELRGGGGGTNQPGRRLRRKTRP